MKVFKIVGAALALIALFALMPTSVSAQDTPNPNSELRVWVGGGLVVGAETEARDAERSLAVAGGIYFPSNLIPIPGFHSFLGVIYDRAESVSSSELDITTWNGQFRFLYYLNLSDERRGLFFTLGPDYKHVGSEDPLAKIGDIWSASTGFGGYVGLGDSKQNRFSFTVERDVMGTLDTRDWKFLAGFSTPANLDIF